MDIATLYLDTTFCHPSASQLPSRVSSVEVSKVWGRGNGGHAVLGMADITEGENKYIGHGLERT